MKNLIALPLLCLCLSLSAQTTEKKTFAPVDIYHGAMAGIGRQPYEHQWGYYADFYLYKKLWLFTDYSITAYFSSKSSGGNFRNFALNLSPKVAFRFNRPNAKFTYFPFIGVNFSPVFLAFKKNNEQWNRLQEYDWGLNIPVGFEAKMRIKQALNLSLGCNVNLPTRNTLPYSPQYLFYLKFGWNKYKKEKKKTE